MIPATFRLCPFRLFSRYILGLGWVAMGVSAQSNLIEDGLFERYRQDTPGPWEFRYGHKGGQSPKARPRWQVVSRVETDVPGRGRILAVGKKGAAAGSVYIGQRVALPNPLPPLGLGIHYQCFCQSEGRCGIVALHLFTPEKWDSMDRDPERSVQSAPRADIFEEIVQPQGPDVTVWTLGRVSSSHLRKALARFAGKEVVVAVSFLTWHETSNEWARLDGFWLGDPLPYIDAVRWPSYLYRGEAVDLTAEAFYPDREARVILRFRTADTDEGPWTDLPMRDTKNDGQYRATIPASAVSHPLEARAAVVGTDNKAHLQTEVVTMKLTERPEHPNLFYSKTELQRMREKIQQYAWAEAAYDGIKRNADAWLKKPFKPEVVSGAWWHHYGCRDCGARLTMEGPRRHVCSKCDKVWDTDILYGVYWSKVHGDHARAARDLALTYQMTHDDTYAKRAIQVLTWYADHYAEFPTADKGGKVVSQTLDECVWLLKIMEAADLVYPVMTRDEATHIERDLIRAGAMYTRKYRGGIHNIRCWHNSCWASAGYFLGDPEMVAYAREGRHGFVAQMEKGVLDDGMWYERSMGYHYYTVSAITYHLLAAKHAGDDLYRMPKVRKLLTFPILIAFPNLVPPSLNDGGFSTRPISPTSLELAAAWYDDPAAISALGKRYAMGAKRTSIQAWQFGEALPQGEAFTPPPSMDLKGAGLAALRRGNGPDAACVMVEYGEHGGGHGHPDKLQLILYALGNQRFPDLGTTGYANPLHPNYYKTTPAHNTVTIGGKNMAPRSGKLLDFVKQDRFSAASARSAEVYPGYVLTRRVLLGEAFVVDEFVIEGQNGDTLDWFLRADGELTLHIEAKPIQEEPLSRPYRYLKNLRAGTSAENWSAIWVFGEPDNAAAERPRLRTTMKGQPGTQIASCDAPGAARRGELWGTLRVRREAAATRFLAVHQFAAPGSTMPDVQFTNATVTVGNAVVLLPESLEQAPALK